MLIHSTMTPSLCSLSPLHFLFFFFTSSFASSSSPLLRGVHPLEVTYFESELIKCKDGSNSFTRDRVNDDFCDCVDGTDEPGTSACANGKFYCRNLGSKPSLLFSSRVNDHICDCCDGSDEYDGVADCPNTCVMGGTINYKPEHRHKMSPPTVVHTKEKELNGKIDVLHYLKDLKVLIMIQLLAIIYVLGLWVFYRHMQSRRRRH